MPNKVLFQKIRIHSKPKLQVNKPRQYFTAIIVTSKILKKRSKNLKKKIGFGTYSKWMRHTACILNKKLLVVDLISLISIGWEQGTYQCFIISISPIVQIRLLKIMSFWLSNFCPSSNKRVRYLNIILAWKRQNISLFGMKLHTLVKILKNPMSNNEMRNAEIHLPSREFQSNSVLISLGLVSFSGISAALEE